MPETRHRLTGSARRVGCAIAFVASSSRGDAGIASRSCRAPVSAVSPSRSLRRCSRQPPILHRLCQSDRRLRRDLFPVRGKFSRRRSGAARVVCTRLFIVTVVGSRTRCGPSLPIQRCAASELFAALAWLVPITIVGVTVFCSRTSPSDRQHGRRAARRHDDDRADRARRQPRRGDLPGRTRAAVRGIFRAHRAAGDPGLRLSHLLFAAGDPVRLGLSHSLGLHGGPHFYVGDVARLELLESIYFSIVSITTVGYGDIVPHRASLDCWLDRGHLRLHAALVRRVGALGIYARAPPCDEAQMPHRTRPALDRHDRGYWHARLRGHDKPRRRKPAARPSPSRPAPRARSPAASIAGRCRHRPWACRRSRSCRAPVRTPASAPLPSISCTTAFGSDTSAERAAQRLGVAALRHDEHDMRRRQRDRARPRAALNAPARSRPWRRRSRARSASARSR